MSKFDLSKLDEKTLISMTTPRMTKYIPITPTTKQAVALLLNDKKEMLYGGAAGGGKSVFQLAAALQFVDIPGYSAILFRKTYADLALPNALISMAKEWLAPFVNSGEVKWSEKHNKFTFPSGATLSFGYLETDNDCYRYQGSEFQYVGIDECTHISPKNYEYMFSRLRKTKELKVPLRFRATANPGGQYGEYYYTRFFENKKDNRFFMSAGIDDNPHLDSAEYIEMLDELDEITREQLLNGNWEIREDGDMFKKDFFIEINDADLAPRHQIVRFWDLASTDPTRRKSKKDRKNPDYTASVLLSLYQGVYTILDIKRVQKGPKEVEDLIRQTALEDGYSVAVRMEEEPGSSGKVVSDHYARNVLQGFDFKAISSTGSKAERARPVATAAENGNILIRKHCPNKKEFITEASLFPYGVKDDMVDALSGAFNHFRTAQTRSAPRGMSVNKGSYWRGSGI